MKLTIYALAEDTRHDGTSVELFHRKRDLHRAQRAIIEQSLANEDEPDETVREIQQHLNRGEIDDAWQLWEDEYRTRSMIPDTYSIEEQTFDIAPPKPDLLVILEGGCVQNVISTLPVGKVRILDYDCHEEPDGTSIFNIPQDEGKDEEAYVSQFRTERAGRWYRQAMSAIATQSKEANAH